MAAPGLILNKKSCTTWDAEIHYYLSTGAGFLPSRIWLICRCSEAFVDWKVYVGYGKSRAMLVI